MPGKDHFLFYEKFRETSKLTKEEIQLMLVFLPSNVLSMAMDLNFDTFFLPISYQKEKLSI